MAGDIGIPAAGLPTADPRLAILARMFQGGVQPSPPNGGIPTTAATPFGMTKQPGPAAGGPPLPTGAKPSQGTDTPAEGQPFPSEAEYNAKNPAPQEKPYVEPDLKHRLLEGIFAGMMNVGQRGSGNEVLNKYLDSISQGEEANKTLPQRNAAAAHQAYMTAAEGAKAPLDIASMQQELENRRKQAAAKPQAPTVEQQYADAIASGDEAGAQKALAAIKSESGAKAKPIIESLAQRYADAVEKGDTQMAERLLEGMRAQSKAVERPEKQTPFDVWRQQNPHAPISDWLKLQGEQKDEAASQKNLDALRRERETVAKDYEARITSITTSPDDAARLRTEEQQRLATYDRQIHNFEQGYKEGDIVPYTDPKTGKQADYKIKRILPDGRLQLEPATKK